MELGSLDTKWTPRKIQVVEAQFLTIAFQNAGNGGANSKGFRIASYPARGRDRFVITRLRYTNYDTLSSDQSLTGWRT